MPSTSRRQFLKSVGATGYSLLLAGTTAVWGGATQAKAEIHVGGRQLLFDDFLLHPGNENWVASKM